MSVVLADLRAFRAATLADWRIMRRYPLRLLNSVFWPIVLPAVYVVQAYAYEGGSQAALAAFAARTGTLSIAGFVYVGWAMFSWLSQILWGPGTSLREQQVEGQLEALFVTPASRAAVLFGPAATSLLLAIWVFGVVGAVLRFVFGVPIGWTEAGRALAVIVVASPAIFGIGVLFSVGVLLFRQIEGPVQFVRGTFTVFCGMSFPIALLPSWAHAVALALPPTYVIADLRRVLLAGSRLAPVLPDLLLLLGAGAALALAAVLALAGTERYARRGGSLGEH